MSFEEVYEKWLAKQIAEENNHRRRELLRRRGLSHTAEVEFYQQKLKNSWKNIMQLHTLCANSSTSIGYKQMVATIEKVQTTILQSNLLEEQHQAQTLQHNTFIR